MWLWKPETIKWWSNVKRNAKKILKTQNNQNLYSESFNYVHEVHHTSENVIMVEENWNSIYTTTVFTLDFFSLSLPKTFTKFQIHFSPILHGSQITSMQRNTSTFFKVRKKKHPIISRNKMSATHQVPGWSYLRWQGQGCKVTWNCLNNEEA